MPVRPLLLFSFALLVICLPATRAFSASEKSQRTELGKYLEAEKYVLEQVAVGNIADLKEKFPNDEQKRILPANFLEGLLLNPNQVKVNRVGVLIVNARFAGAVNLANTDIENFAYLVNCEFDDVFFFQTVFKKGLTIDGSTFKGKATFSFATVMAGLSANGAKFLNEVETAAFDTFKVNGPAMFIDANFFGPVSFVYSKIDGPFILNGAKFICKPDPKTPCEKTSASFNTMKISGGFFAYDAVFERPVDCINLRANDNFEAKQSTFKESATLEMMSLGHNLYLSEATFMKGASIRSSIIPENVELEHTHFLGNGSAEFSGAKVGTVLITDTEFKYAPDLSNFSYQNIYPHTGVLDLVRNSGSDYSAYTELERYLQKSGHTSQADEVFMEMKKYERRKGMNWFDKFKSYLSQGLQGFGRRPQRVVYYDLAVVLFGMFVFRRRHMILKENRPAAPGQPEPNAADCPPYNSLLYSLTLFAPAIDTQYTNNWKPESKDWKARWYFRAHQVLGYILVPLTIGVWTGVFK